MHHRSRSRAVSVPPDFARIILLVITPVLFMLAAATQTFAMQIKTVKSNSGIEAWLVEDHSIPLISMQFAFRAGSTQDPAGREGLAYFVSGTLDEGAGDLPSRQFQQRMEDLAMKLSFEASLDSMKGSLQTLTVNRDASFELLRIALSQPRFEGEDVERIRTQILSRLKAESQDPESIAAQEWFRLAFGSHPYSRPLKGTLDTVSTISPDDLRAFVRKTFARDNLKISVVGDITADDLKVALDTIFGALPPKAELAPVPDAQFTSSAQTAVVQFPNPQSVAQFGLPALKRKDPDFIPAFILNYILGGGSFSSTLMQEVREKRGLAYSVYTYLYPLDHAGLMLGGVATENKSVKQSLEVIQAELARLAANGPTADELDGAKRYLTGSYALRFDSNVKIAGQLLGTQMENLGIDYVTKRNSLIEAVTIEDMKRVAARLLKANNLIVTVVGQPEGFTVSTTPAPRG